MSNRRVIMFQPNHVLKPLRINQPLVLSAMIDDHALARSHDLFSFIYNSVAFPAQSSNDSLGEIDVTLCRITSDASSNELLNVLPVFYQCQCFSQGHIRQFVEKYSKHLQPDGFATLFPYLHGKKICLAEIQRNHNGHIFLRNHNVYDHKIWAKCRKHYLAIPWRLKLEE